jgi:hypothetical protein
VERLAVVRLDRGRLGLSRSRFAEFAAVLGRRRAGEVARAWCVRRNTESNMKLRIVDELIEMVGRVHRLSRVVGRRDRNLAEQMRDAATGIGTNEAFICLASSPSFRATTRAMACTRAIIRTNRL